MIEQGEMAARQILGVLAGHQPTDLLLPTHLVLRASTAAPRQHGGPANGRQRPRR
jgi:DNA-binding LacI/PurR family transcriptional regulator